MPSTPYHHGNLREALVDAAIDVAREQGPSGLALRDLARRVGVSHNAAYRHFADRDALVEAVAVRGMTELMRSMQRRVDEVDTDDPVLRARRRLTAIGRGYVEHAIAAPGLFKVTFGAYTEQVNANADLPGEGDDPAPNPYRMLNEVLDELVDVGFLDPALRRGADTMCWSAMHGFAVLHLDGPLRSLPAADRDAALDTVLISIDRAYGAPGDPDLLG